MLLYCILKKEHSDTDLDNSFEAAWDRSVDYCCMQLYVMLAYWAVHSARSALTGWQSIRESLLSTALRNLASPYFCSELVSDRANLVWKSGWHDFVALCLRGVLRQRRGSSVSWCDAGSWAGLAHSCLAQSAASRAGFLQLPGSSCQEWVSGWVTVWLSVRAKLPRTQIAVLSRRLVPFFRIVNMLKY